MIDLRSIFNELNIDWIDRGKNCPRGRINISCPYCDDPSYHMSIDETGEQYYCWRCETGGQNITRLFVQLGVSYFDVPDLINRHNTEFIPTVKIPARTQTAIAKVWNRFAPAADSRACTEYLSSRGFPSPVATCRQYDLRVAPAGAWAQRLLIPITEQDAVVSWVGRSLRPSLEPKYLIERCDHPVIYVPRRPRDILVVVEGSLDALKIAVATTAISISSVALLGKGTAVEKISRISTLAVNCKRILVALDADVSVVSVLDIVHEVARCVDCPVDYLMMPNGYKDAGDMALDEINNWLEPVI